MSDMTRTPMSAFGSQRPSLWVRRFGERRHHHTMIIGIPFAGGGASLYARWASLAPPWLGVAAIQLPGRECRLAEPAMTSVTEIVEPIVDALTSLSTHQIALYGHSMGALIAYEVTRRLCAEGRPPAHLFLAARRSAQLPRQLEDIHTLDEVAFVEAWNRIYDPLPREIVAEPQLRSLFVPPLRADMAVVETYGWRPGSQVTCPTTGIYASNDPHATREDVAAWRHLVEGTFDVQRVEGEHLFVKNNPSLVVDIIARRLATLRDARQGPSQRA